MMTIQKEIRRRPHEFEIQAKIYTKLLSLGIDAAGEYKYKNCRFDILVFDQGIAVCIVEVKSYIDPEKHNYETKQIKKYEKFGIPVLLCGHETKIESTIEEITNILSESKWEKQNNGKYPQDEVVRDQQSWL